MDSGEGFRFHTEFHTTETEETFATDFEEHSLEPVNYKKIVCM